MKKTSSSSLPPQKTQMHPLEAARLELNKHFRDSGRSVEVATPSDGTEYTVTFPQARRPVKVSPVISCRALITVEWGYDNHSIKLTAKDWFKVKSGNSLSKKGKGYYYEGTFFQDYWYFGGGLEGSLSVRYGDDGGEGFNGSLNEAIIEELTK